MKRFVGAFLGAALCLCLASGVALAAPGRGVQGVQQYPTVGEFAVELAKSIGNAAATPESAVEALRGAGIVLNGKLDRPLTQGDVVNLLSQAGIKVTTSDPSQRISRDQAGAIVGTFGPEMARKSGLVNAPCVGCNEASGPNPNDDFNNGNGGGGKFKRKKKNSQTGSD